MKLPAQSVSNGCWQAQSIYQIITDRFFDGDPSNNNAGGNYNPSGATSVHGGDFQGLEAKLDYVKALGATAIWISPVVLNGHGQFHGYAARDFYRVDPHWGSLADLQHFIAAAHVRGLLVIDDIVCNHGDDLIYSTDAGYGNFLHPPAGYTLKYRSSSRTFAPPFDVYNSTYNATNNALTNLFHNNGLIQNFNDLTQVRLGELSGLDDFRTESTFVRSNMAAIYEFWIQQAGFDGFRIDTVKHVETGFWQSWCPAVHDFAATNGRPNFFMFGEVYDADEALCGSFTGTRAGGAYALDSVLDYPLYFMVGSVFASASGNTKQISDHYAKVSAYYDTNAQMRLVTFLDNHDQARFLNSSTTNRLAVALTFLYTSRGIPCLYYGTEQAFNGATDPYDREDMFAGQFKDAGQAGVDSFNMTQPLFRLVAQLNNFRRLYPALSLGSQVDLANNASGPGLFAYARRLGAQEAFVVLNTAGSTQILAGCGTSYPPGTRLVNLLDVGEIITVTGASQTPAISVPASSAKIFLAQSQVLPLDPVVVTNYPLHAASAVPTWSPIVLHFSEPMDTNSVQNAFTISPAVGGGFSWSATRDTLTFTPGGAGLAGLTNLLVRLTNSASAALSSNTMFAPYELKFTTAASSFHDVMPPTLSLTAPANGTVISGALAISGIATDDTAVVKVEFQLDHDGWQPADGLATWSASLNSSNFLNGPHQIFARAADAAGNLSATDSVTVIFSNVPGSYLERVSGGNPANVTDCSANVWRKDLPYSFGAFGYAGGTGGYLANSINGICAAMQPLFQRERYSTSNNGFYYQFDCPAGIYETTLLESETYWSGSGQRVFNAFIQGRQVLTNFDIFGAAGGKNLPLKLTFTNAVTNSRLQILFTPVVDNARVSGVQVRKIADVYSDTDGIADWWRLANFGHALGWAADHSRGTDDADADGVSNLTEFRHGTDPANPNSVPLLTTFHIGQVAVTAANVQLRCVTETNWSYQLQSRETLDPASAWTNCGVELAGLPGTILFTDPDPVANRTRFYRVQAR